MNDFQIYYKKYSKLSLQKNNNQKIKAKNIPQGLKGIFITNSNGLEISSQYGNFHRNSKKNMLEDNYNIKHITYNNSNNKNFSFPINTTSSNKNINFKYKDNSLINQKNNLFKIKFSNIYLNNSKKEENSYHYNSKENTHNNINLNNNINCILNKNNINIIPKKSNYKFINFKDNNISLNSNKNIGKSMSKSKSKSKSKNQRENKSYNNKINNDINKIILDKYLKLNKMGEKGHVKKAKTKNLNILHKESPNYNISKYSNDINNSDIHKMSSLNMITNIQFKGLRKKNKSTNLLINNINNIYKPKNMHISKTKTNIIITKIESNNNINFNNIKNNNNKSDNINNNNNVKNNKKYLTENHIMYLNNNKNFGPKKRKVKNNKDKQISLKDIKNDSNTNANTNTNTNNNISNNNNLINYLIEKTNNQILNHKNVIYDYKSNNIFLRKRLDNNVNFNINKNSKKNIINNNNENINSDNNMYKILNERLKTEYNENNSLEIIDKMYEEENTEEINQKSMSFSQHDSFRLLYPDIYNRDDEYFVENENSENNNNDNNKKEKELDETESPIKIDTDKVTNENSGVLSFDQVKDIICYYNMNNQDKQNDFLFKKNERQIYDINKKNKYVNFFFGNYINYDNDKNNDNDIIDDIKSFKTNINFKYPSSSIFSLDTEYSSKMKKKFNKNLVKNI